MVKAAVVVVVAAAVAVKLVAGQEDQEQQQLHRWQQRLQRAKLLEPCFQSRNNNGTRSAGCHDKRENHASNNRSATTIGTKILLAASLQANSETYFFKRQQSASAAISGAILTITSLFPSCICRACSKHMR